jgi:hypothetical protein
LALENTMIDSFRLGQCVRGTNFPGWTHTQPGEIIPIRRSDETYGSALDTQIDNHGEGGTDGIFAAEVSIPSRCDIQQHILYPPKRLGRQLWLETHPKAQKFLYASTFSDGFHIMLSPSVDCLHEDQLVTSTHLPTVEDLGGGFG